MKSWARLCLCLIALVGLPLLVVPERSSAAEAVTDMGALRKQVTSGEITAETPAGSFITTRHDDSGWVSWQMAALKYEPPKIPLVLIVGGSAARECITEDDALAAAISQQSGAKVKVVTAATTMQRLPSTLAIIDNLPVGSGVVVIAISHGTFVSTQADAEGQLRGMPLLLASPALREVTAAQFGAAQPANILPGLQHHVDTYEDKRGVAAFTGRELIYRRHRYDAYGASSLGIKRILATRFAQGDGAPGGPFFTYFDFSVALLQRCVAVARAKGYEVLLMQDPLDSTAAGDAYAPYMAKYQPEVERIADEEKAHYVNLNETAALVDGDFLDLFHLMGSGREKWMTKLSASLAEIVRDDVTATATTTPPGSPSTSAAPPNAATVPAADNRGDWPLWQMALVAVVACVLFLAVLRRRAAVRRRTGSGACVGRDSTRRR